MIKSTSLILSAQVKQARGSSLQLGQMSQQGSSLQLGHNFLIPKMSQLQLGHMSQLEQLAMIKSTSLMLSAQAMQARMRRRTLIGRARGLSSRF